MNRSTTSRGAALTVLLNSREGVNRLFARRVDELTRGLKLIFHCAHSSPSTVNRQPYRLILELFDRHGRY
jgi:hypothetical protein